MVIHLYEKTIFESLILNIEPFSFSDLLSSFMTAFDFGLYIHVCCPNKAMVACTLSSCGLQNC